MEWSKLKNIIIILLVLLNMSFLVLMGSRGVGTSAVKEQTKKSVLAFFHSHEISMSEEIVPWDLEQAVYITERDQTEEMEIAKTLLGEILEYQTGALTEYITEDGKAEFHADGRFSIDVYEGVKVPVGMSEVEHALLYLRNIGMEAVLFDEETDQYLSLRFLQTLDDMPVFNCVIDMEYQNGALQAVYGRRLSGEAVPDENQKMVLPSTTLLVRLIELVEEKGVPCEKIESITRGYLYMTGALSSSVRAIPVWRIQTDAGEIVLNALTGKQEKMSIKKLPTS